MSLAPLAGMARSVRRIHMVGIGGAGMSGIAEVLVSQGFELRGSDLRRTEVTERLARLGIDIRVGHDAAAVEGAQVVVISTAVPPNNPELVRARELGVPVIRRAEMLAELMRNRLGVAVAGSHGKTTTTSMVASILGAAGLDPTVVVGGKLNAMGSGARLGQGAVMVAEADESDGSFLHLSPTIAAVTNVDAEHLDHYAGEEEVRAAFRSFLQQLPFYGLAVLCIDHPGVRALLPGLERRVVTYGFSPQADLRAEKLEMSEGGAEFEVWAGPESRGRHQLSMVGAHNVSNALAALAIAEELSVDPQTARRGLAEFSGVDRRFSVRGEARGVLVVDDYGHHPAEIEATLRGAREAYPGRRLVVAFQPHRYTRTAQLLEEFGQAFHQAETVFVLPVYAAGERPIKGADAWALIAAMKTQGHRDVRALDDLDLASPILALELRAHDLFIAFGAGDVARLGRDVLRALESVNLVDGSEVPS